MPATRSWATTQRGEQNVTVTSNPTIRQKGDSMRFSIRDLLWATLVVALGLGWWVSDRAMDAKRLEAVGQAHRQRATLADAKLAHDQIDSALYNLETGSTITARWPVDWSILDEPLVEP
jgi:hypothetical protein